MELKAYQERVLKEVKDFLDKLAEHQAAQARRPSMDGWKILTMLELIGT